MAKSVGRSSEEADSGRSATSRPAHSLEIVERVAQVIDPRLADLPRINLYRQDFERAWGMARKIIEIVARAHVVIMPDGNLITTEHKE